MPSPPLSTLVGATDRELSEQEQAAASKRAADYAEVKRRLADLPDLREFLNAARDRLGGRLRYIKFPDGFEVRAGGRHG